ncbi:MAG TPA: T9SS type A sorting domain-containing protein, partial [Bacteroidia bacterium]|nr:T9SS type A sorting domain-containing protein [Bacteroidia bacterium]
NGGTSWKNITGTLPVSLVYISGIAVDPNNPQRLWVTFSGWNKIYKVFKSTNGGATWTNISGGLPNLPVNCITYQPGSPDGIYLGTDKGVYYMDNTTSGWIPFNAGLPNVEVFDLKIYSPGNLLLAATFGRGTWETPTYVNVGINQLSFTNYVKVYPNPAKGNVHVAFDGAAGDYELTMVDILGRKVYSENIKNTGHYDGSIDVSEFGSGVYIVSINGKNGKTEKKVVVY